MRQYKLILVIRSSLKDAERKKLLGSIKDFLGKVKITKEEDLGQKALAYPIKKEVSGVFAKVEFEAEAVLQDFEKKILNNDDVLRHLLIKQ